MNSTARSTVSPLPPGDLEHVLTHTRALWEELRGQRLFLTGGTGFFGLWLLETFIHANEHLSLGARATVLTRAPAAFAVRAPHLAGRPELEFVQGDVRNFVFPEGEFLYVIHAGTTSGGPVEPLEMFDTIVQGTRRVLDFAATHGTRKFLFISSGAVYGKQPPELTHIPEDYAGAPNPLDPASAYGEGKRAAELLCSLISRKHGFEAKIARCFTFVGPHLPLDAHFAVGNFIRDALAGGPIVVKNGAPYRSYLYAADLAIWLWTILFAAPAGRLYNAGDDGAVSISDLARAVAALHDPTLPVLVARASAPGERPARYVPDTSRAMSELNLRAYIPLADALARTYHWHADSAV